MGHACCVYLFLVKYIYKDHYGPGWLGRVVDENGDISLQNLYKRTVLSSKTIVGSLRDENLLFQSTPVWGAIKASASGEYIYGATRKMIQLFDLRSRPRHHGSAIRLFSIAKDRNTAKESILTEAVFPR